MNKLNKLYEAMLKSWGCSFTNDYAILLNMSGVEVPVKVEDKQVYLATSENLNGVAIGKVFFHPACESIMSKETEIFKVIRKLTSAKIYAVFQPIFEVIVAVASKKSGKTLTGKMLDQLEPFKTITKSVKSEVIEIIKTISITLEDQGIDTRLINFTLIKGGKTDNDETAYYTATPTFPFYTELYRTVSQNEHMKPADRLTFNSLNVSIHAMRIVIALFELALPACVDPSRKKYSSTSADAARLVAYLHSYGLVVSDLNSLIGKFRKEFDAIGIYGIDIEWLSELDEISEIKSLIPTLDYNNYNLTSSSDSSSSSNSSGGRISSYNPMNMFNTNGNQQNNQQTQTPSQAPKIPDTLNGETYMGCEYSPTNGIYEYKFQQPTGLIRVRRLAEDGRFISEDMQLPQQQNQGMMNGNMFNQQQMLLNPMMMGGMMGGSGIPLMGIGQPNMGVGGYVRDPYTGMPVPSNGIAQNNGLSPSIGNQSQGIIGGTVGINDYY